jgi:hypothetical protein
MLRCLYFKNDGQQCTREISHKENDNPLFCWQHQDCEKSLSTQSTTEPTNEETSSGEIEKATKS